ncbi:MAG: MerC family mercury resistance protein [Candidatus Neomarinimicrobiota bacterium]
MAFVEFIYEKNCPNIAKARMQLLRAFSALNIKPHWLEWEVNDAEAPEYVRQYGSPTIMVDGRDVDGTKFSDNTNHCRLYLHSDNTSSGVPAVESIMQAMQGYHHKDVRSSRFPDSGLKAATIPVILFSLLPKLICPFCWPLYTGLLGSVGINFINYTPYLFPLLTLFLILTVSGLIYGARRKNKYAPVCLGGLSSLLILIGKFLNETDILIYIGLTGLIVSVIWQSRINFSGNRDSCSACKSD